VIGSFGPERLRAGELIAGAGALALLAFTFLLEWYAGPASRAGVSMSINGWHGLTDIRWLILLTTVAAILLVALQGTRPAPALPVTMSLIVTVLGALTLLGLLYRVVIDVPGPHLHREPGAFLGLLSSIVLAYGGYASLRKESVAGRDGPQEIERIVLRPGDATERP